MPKYTHSVIVSDVCAHAVVPIYKLNKALAQNKCSRFIWHFYKQLKLIAIIPTAANVANANFSYPKRDKCYTCSHQK